MSTVVVVDDDVVDEQSWDGLSSASWRATQTTSLQQRHIAKDPPSVPPGLSLCLLQRGGLENALLARLSLRPGELANDSFAL